MGAADRNAEALAADLRRRLVEHRRAEAAAGRAGGDDLESAVAEMVDDHAAVLSERRRARIRELILRDTVGLGPLEQVLADPAVTEVMVNGPHEVYVERRGRIEPTEVRFASEGALRDAIERILAPLGRRVDELSPMVDGRLADGSRVNVVIPPLSVDGPALSIRRFTGARPGPDELVASGTLTAELRDLLAEAVRGRRSMLISGGTGSGKTTLLNALSAYIGSEERVITIEDAAELRLRQPHVVRLESRPPSVEGRGEVTIRDLLRNALRMRPDRIVIGEVRGGEALDLLTALNTGHDGALSTLHANSPADALRRLETLALMADVGLPHEAIREQVRRGIELVVHLARSPQGERRVVEVGEVVRRGRWGRRQGAVAPMSADPLATPVLLAAAAGGMAAVAAREAVLATPALGRWLADAVEPLRRAGREGYAPTEAERRRLAAVGTGALLLCVLFVAGPGPAPLGAVAGPGAAAWAVARRRARYRRAVERGLPQVATAVADALAGGRSVRAALASAASSMEGPPAAELARLRADLELGASTAAALAALKARLRSERVDSFAAALLSQQLGGGDLAGLLRRFAASSAERDRVAADAHAATAQARFTGLLVVAMPAGAALFAELIEPGFVGGLLSNGASAALLAAAAAFQLGGFASIRRLSRIEDG